MARTRASRPHIKKSKSKSSASTTRSKKQSSQNSNTDRSAVGTKWLDSGQLRELGLEYKKGRYTNDENHIIRDTIEKYKKDKGIDDGQFAELISGINKPEHKAFWKNLGEALGDRPLRSVVHRVQRIYHPYNENRASWTPKERARLKKLVELHGRRWAKIGQILMRKGTDCRDQYREHIELGTKKKLGAWTIGETNRLWDIMMTHLASGNSPDRDIPWTLIKEKFGNTRTLGQIFSKWFTDLRVRVEQGADELPKRKWHVYDSFELIKRLNELVNVKDELDVPWEKLGDETWNWPVWSLRRHWGMIKRRYLENFDQKTFDQQVIELYDMYECMRAESPDQFVVPKTPMYVPEDCEDEEF